MRELLDVITMSVQEPDADERNAEVGCTLDMVTCQDAKSTRILLHALVECEFAAEVCDKHVAVSVCSNASEPCARLVVLLTRGERLLHDLLEL